MGCFRFYVLLMLIAVFVVGCSGGSGGPPLNPVGGKVTLRGEPLANAKVTFLPTAKTEGIGGTGKTDEQGKYQVTYKRGGTGLPAGKYKVTVSRRLMPDGSEPDPNVPPIESPAAEKLPPKYSNDAKTILEAQVPGRNSRY